MGDEYQKSIELYGDSIGRVEYVEHMGTDLSVVNSARVSFGQHKEGLDEIVNEYNLSKAQKSQLVHMYTNKGNEKRFNKIESKFMDSVKNPIAEKRVERIWDRAIKGNLSKNDKIIIGKLDKEKDFYKRVEHYKKNMASDTKKRRFRSLVSDKFGINKQFMDIIKESL